MEFRRWIHRFRGYIDDGVKLDVTGGPRKSSGELLNRQLLNKVDNHCFNKLSDQLSDVRDKDWAYFESLIRDGITLPHHEKALRAG